MQRNKKQTAEKSSQSASGKVNKSLRNGQLQALIGAINSMINDKLKFTTRSGLAILNLAQVVEDAFRPAAKMLEQIQKDAQERVGALVDVYGDNKEVDGKVNPDLQKEVDVINAEFINKTNEVQDVLVNIEFEPLSDSVFNDERGNPLSLGLDVQHALRPFIKG